MVTLTLDRDAGGHLAVALHALATRNRTRGRVFPAALVALQAAAENVVQTGESMHLTIADAQDTSQTLTRAQKSAGTNGRRDGREDQSHAPRDYLSRRDVAELASVSIATVDRWIASGELPASRCGRVRRIRREDLEGMLGRAA